MRRISLPIQTLYADLAQKVTPGAPVPGSVSVRTVHGVERLYSTERHGGSTIQRYIGVATDPAVIARADAIRREAELAKQRRKSITMLKAAGLQAPSLAVGRVLEEMSRAGLFENGVVLVGTVAFQTYPALIGYHLESSAMMTQDVDVAATTVRAAIPPTEQPRDGADAAGQERQGEAVTEFLAVLRLADPSFAPAPTLVRNALPSKFRTAGGLDVELLTPVRHRNEVSPVPLPALRASAVALHFLEYVVAEAVPVVALHGSGVRILVPQPARYAAHKLIVAQRRQQDGAKRAKDLAQAKTLMAALDDYDPDALDDAIDDARARGPHWRAAVDAGLAQIGRA
jgi:hypothetical protein